MSKDTRMAENAPAVLHEARARSLDLKYFGSVNALEDISLSVYSGQVTCVLGDNGAGKSTLIKILSGVYAPDKGEVLFDGEPVSFAARARRGREESPPCSRIWRRCR